MDTGRPERPSSTFGKIMNYFSRDGSSTTKGLFKWKQSGEQEEWANKAVDALVKKLKKQPNSIRNFQEALRSKSASSQCVTIPRSIDGRMQVN